MPIVFPSNPTTNQTYTYNGRTWTWSGTRWKVQGGGTGGTGSTVSAAKDITWANVQTANFTANVSTGYPVNTTSSNITVTLPANPATGDQVQFIDYAGTWNTNFVNISTNSNKINGSTDNVKLITHRGAVTLTYVDSTQGWTGSDAFAITSLSPPVISYLVVAGGGGGGSCMGGGGGAGGLLTAANLSITYGSPITVTVGAGGTGGIRSDTVPLMSGGDGSNSVLGSLTAVGGGGGGGVNASVNAGYVGRNGGSGGGGATGSKAGGTAINGQGYNGGTSPPGGSTNASAGGGGASAPGGPGADTVKCGDGGAGVISYITGSMVTYAGGGGGGAYCNMYTSYGGAGSGGSGGGGSGGGGGAAVAGTQNLGGGGGGGALQCATSGQVGAAGGSGIVIIAYSNLFPPISNINPGLTYDQPTRPGYHVYRFTAGTGTISW